MGAIDEAADTLNRVCQKVDYDLTGPPTRKVVITASGYAYDCPDGVTVGELHRWSRRIGHDGRL